MVANNLSYHATVRSVCKESFYEFVKEFWDTIIASDPVWNWHIEVLCKEMQRTAERVFLGQKCEYDLLINIPPGSTKSTICSVMFPAWVWTRMPSAQFICASYTGMVALDLARRCKDILVSEKYQLAFPDIVIRSEALTQILNEKGGFRLAVGTGGVTGLHAHFIIVDDPIDPQATKSDTEREKAVDWMTQTLSTRKINKEVSVTILVMQRLHQADPAALMLGKIVGKTWGNPVKHICLPWKLSDDVRPKKLRARYDKDGLLDPIRISSKIGEAFRAKLGSFGFSCQFEQSPVPLEGGMFETDKIHIGKAPPLAQFVRKIVRYWDNGATEGAGTHSVGVKMGILPNGDIWILNVKRGQWHTNKRERIKLQTAQRDTREVRVGIEEEGGSSGKDQSRATVKLLIGFNAIVDRPTGDKVIRADPFSVQVNNGNVYLSDEGIEEPNNWQAIYIDELKYFPASQYKDQVDASSGAFKLLTSRRLVGAAFPPTEQEISEHKFSFMGS